MVMNKFRFQCLVGILVMLIAWSSDHPNGYTEILAHADGSIRVYEYGPDGKEVIPPRGETEPGSTLAYEYSPGRIAEIPPRGEPMIPTITGLDFAKVRIVVFAAYAFIDKLQERAEKRLEAELGPRDMNAEPVGSLIINLNCKPRVIAGHEIFQCQSNLEFKERVIPVRNVKMPPESRIVAPATTWAYYAPMPDIRESISIEELEADLDECIEEFIRAYKLGRWWAKKWEKEKESNANQKDEADPDQVDTD